MSTEPSLILWTERYGYDVTWISAILYSLVWFICTLIRFRLYKMRVDRRRLVKAPGTYLLAVVDFLFPAVIVEQAFKPLVADWRHEYLEALKHGRKWKARWVSFRYRFSFINTMTLSKIYSFLKQLKSVSK